MLVIPVRQPTIKDHHVPTRSAKLHLSPSSPASIHDAVSCFHRGKSSSLSVVGSVLARDRLRPPVVRMTAGLDGSGSVRVRLAGLHSWW